MASKELNVIIKHRYDTSSNWTTNNPVLLAGELGIESDTGRFKIGNGDYQWTILGYFDGNILDAIQELQEDKVGQTQLTNVLNEIDIDIQNSNTHIRQESTESGMTTWTSAVRGDICIRSDVNKTFILLKAPASTLDNWAELKAPVPSVYVTKVGRDSINTHMITVTRMNNGQSASSILFSIIDNLATDSPTDVLSAKQGKVLYDMIQNAGSGGTKIIWRKW